MPDLPQPAALTPGDLMRAGAALRLRALAHPLRLRLIEILARRKAATVNQLADDLLVRPAAVSKHLCELARAGLVVRAKDGNFAIYRVAHPECAQLVAVAYRLVGRNAEDLREAAAALAEPAEGAGGAPRRSALLRPVRSERRAAPAPRASGPRDRG